MSSIRKKTFAESPPVADSLDLVSLASFEMTSEEPEHPLERALEEGPGEWRAATDGPQTIRLTFYAPQRISRVTFVFLEHSISRTQEFALFARLAAENEWRQLVRQQFNFSPPHTTREQEDYALTVADVIALELRIFPGAGRASLSRFAVA